MVADVTIGRGINGSLITRMPTLKRINHTAGVTTLCFSVYIYFLFDYFLRFSARVPAYGLLRPTFIVIGLITLLLLFQKLSFKEKFQDPIFKSIYFLVIYIVITLPFVEWPGSVVKNNLDDFIKAIVFLIFTALIIDTEKRFKIFLGVFLGCQVFRVIEPLYLHITQGYWGSKTHIGGGVFAERLAGAPADVINANELGFVIVTAIPFLHYLLWPGRWYAKLIYICLLPLLLYALVLTSSRGAFIALLVVLWHLFKSSNIKGIFIVVLLLGATVIWVNLSDFQKERYLSIFGGSGTQAATAQGRKDGIIGELKLGLERPIVGHGLGTTREAKFHIVGGTQASHNLYAELLIELGIFGAIIFLTFLKRIHSRFKSNRLKLLKLRLDRKDFYYRLNMAMTAVFWMYVVYSINYWGLSQYYWYLFGGLSIAFAGVIDQRLRLIPSQNAAPSTLKKFSRDTL